ncbi:MAG: cupin-like domain-containing protein [Myxococcota bacterium]
MLRIATVDRAGVVALVRAGLPALVTDGPVRQWPAMGWTPDSLARDHGDARVRVVVDAPDGAPWDHPASVHLRDTTLRDYVALLRDPARPAPCYLALEPLARVPGLVDQVAFGGLCPDGDVRFSVGSPGVQIGVHFDYEDNVFVQLYGHKRFCLVSPDQSARLYPSRYNVTQSALDDAMTPDLARFPRFADADVIEDEIGPGECLVLPRTWWHQFRSVDETVSLGCFFGRASFVRELAPIVNQLGAGYWAELARQFVAYGLLGRPPDDRLYSHPPNGLVLYTALRQRLRGRPARTDGSFFE